MRGARLPARRGAEEEEGGHTMMAPPIHQEEATSCMCSAAELKVPGAKPRNEKEKREHLLLQLGIAVLLKKQTKKISRRYKT